MYRVFDNHLDDEARNSYLLVPEMANNAIHLSRHLKPLKLPFTSCGQVMASVRKTPGKRLPMMSTVLIDGTRRK
jgi:hypothetical protein